jgi:hypothetical protein
MVRAVFRSPLASSVAAAIFAVAIYAVFSVFTGLAASVGSMRSWSPLEPSW